MKDVSKMGRPEVRFKMGSSGTCDHYVYELSAFLAAIKSSLDFVASAASVHIRGVATDTISTFINMVDGGQTGPILDECRKHLEWLKSARDYRDLVVHRRIMTISGGHEVRSVGGQTSAVRRPLVIPEKPPSYVPDTRAARMMEEEVSGLMSLYGETTVTHDDGKKEVIEFSHEFRAAPEYVLIEDFMQRNLQSFEKFFVDIIRTLSGLKFGYAEVR